jgi:hypothetical protein
MEAAGALVLLVLALQQLELVRLLVAMEALELRLQLLDQL